MAVRQGLLCLALIITALAPAPISAQVTAAISGRAEDASGAPMQGAKVTVRSIET